VIRKLISPFILAVYLLGFGCGDSTIWKAAVRSPDGSWIASARTLEGGGFGTGHLYTIVYLQQADSSGTPFGTPLEVLGFSGPIDLTMKWITRSHLEVTYDTHPDLYFQAVKALGVDISVRDLSSETNSPKN
jgi:hypothetical protein